MKDEEIIENRLAKVNRLLIIFIGIVIIVLFFIDVPSKPSITKDLLPKPTNTTKSKLKLTHFLSLPLLNKDFKLSVKNLQNKITELFDENDKKRIVVNSPDLMHITLAVMNLEEEGKKIKAMELFDQMQEQVNDFLKHSKLKINLGGLEFFGYDPTKITQNSTLIEKNIKNNTKKPTGVIYLEVLEDENMWKLRKVANFWLKEFVDNGIINKEDFNETHILHDHVNDIYHAEKYHVTLFRFEEGLNLTKVIENFNGLKFGETYAETIELSMMGKFDETKFYMPLKKHILDNKND